MAFDTCTGFVNFVPRMALQAITDKNAAFKYSAVAGGDDVVALTLVVRLTRNGVQSDRVAVLICTCWDASTTRLPPGGTTVLTILNLAVAPSGLDPTAPPSLEGAGGGNEDEDEEESEGPPAEPTGTSPASLGSGSSYRRGS